MKLSELTARAAKRRVIGSLDVEVSGLAYDSRAVVPGSVFFALAGAATDGNRYVKQAAQAGAVAIVSELAPPPAPFALAQPGSEHPVAWIEVPDGLEAMSRISATFYDDPSARMTVVGVTGTNGKTTTTYLLESIFHAAGRPCGVLGTVDYRIRGQQVEKAPNTTPASLDVQRLLARMLHEEAPNAAMEVSSHALALKRVEDVAFDAAVITNFYRDHLDFHKTREAYLEAKSRLFDLLTGLSNPKKLKIAVLNREDESFLPLKHRADLAKLATFGLGIEADYRAADIGASLNGTLFRMIHRGHESAVRLALIGRYNVLNAVAAAAAALELGLPIDAVVQGLFALKAVPGRLEPVGTGHPFHVFVDYAHTDSALQNVLTTVRTLAHKRIFTVFGCGGDRDRTKRGPMGRVACEMSDDVIVTSDNPRSEDPAAIAREIEEGIKTSGRQNYKILLDRAEAISAAIACAREGDVVLIAGKGHEDYQLIGGKTLHFDDREQALAALKSRGLA